MVTNIDKIEKIIKVIDSCKTVEHTKSVIQWIRNISLESDIRFTILHYAIVKNKLEYALYELEEERMNKKGIKSKVIIKWYEKTLFEVIRKNITNGETLKDYNIYNLPLFKIHLVRAYRNKMEIYTGRPGLIIGEGGRLIHAITAHFRKELEDDKFEVDIIETKNNCTNPDLYSYMR
jgi:uncharacterized membrane protein YheB (UPF0754 family)